jgi:hypothetical protein
MKYMLIAILLSVGLVSCGEECKLIEEILVKHGEMGLVHVRAYVTHEASNGNTYPAPIEAPFLVEHDNECYQCETTAHLQLRPGEYTFAFQDLENEEDLDDMRAQGLGVPDYQTPNPEIQGREDDIGTLLVENGSDHLIKGVYRP